MINIKSNKGNAALTVIVISMVILILSLSLMSVITSTNVQARKQIERLQKFYNIKSELACIQGELELNYSYIHENPTGTMGYVGYMLTSEDYEEEIGVIVDDETGIEGLGLVAREYTYNIDIDGKEVKNVIFLFLIYVNKQSKN